ncbi:hypothetical protein PENTCL1PPCAC_10311, partial [Pristionchus entomophagus]
QISSCLHLFRSIAFNQPKEEQLKEEMEMLGFSSEFADIVIGLKGRRKFHSQIARLSEITHTDLPRLENVDWSIVSTTDGSSSTSSPPGSHSIVMNLHTSKGLREMRMTREEAVALYEKLNEMQHRIDTMLE